MKYILCVLITSMLIMLLICNLIKYINVNDSQNICDKMWLKLIMCILVSTENILLYIKFGFSLEYIGYVIAIIFITITAIIDFYTHCVYEIITVPTLVISVVFYIANIFLKNISIKSSLFIILTYVILKVLCISKSIGEGDLEVYLIISLILCQYNMATFINIIFSMAISGIAGILMLIIKKVDLNYRKPLCPCIAVSTYIILLLV